jgi:1L-myo-inositol 1-phosphate cytidylyltransferase
VSDIRTAIVLAAGAGSRLRPLEPYKPLCRVGGRPLLGHALHGLAKSGIDRAIVVTGYGAEIVEAYVGTEQWPLQIATVRTPDWNLPNGVSVRAAAGLLDGRPALLAMSDHLVDPRLYERVRSAGEGKGLRLGIDRRLGHPWVDPADVTRVRTEGELIVAIGKNLDPHDAYDTGVFAIGPAFFAELEALTAPSITEGVRALAARGSAAVVDCSDLDWIDVDDPAALAKAQSGAWSEVAGGRA